MDIDSWATLSRVLPSTARPESLSLFWRGATLREERVLVGYFVGMWHKESQAWYLICSDVGSRYMCAQVLDSVGTSLHDSSPSSMTFPKLTFQKCP